MGCFCEVLQRQNIAMMVASSSSLCNFVNHDAILKLVH